MRISAKYRRRLENYLEWYKCSTPLTGADLPGTPETTEYGCKYDGAGPTAAEFLASFESLGHGFPTCSEPDLLRQYRLGKANRDWWSKEIGWWNKEAIYCPEEFLGFFTIETFVELFGRYPTTHLVRHCFDNNYSNEQFLEDAREHYRYGIEREQDGFIVKH